MKTQKKTIVIFITASILLFIGSNLFAHDTDVKHPHTQLCSYCDNWFIASEPSQQLCPRCELLKDLTLLKTDPSFVTEKLNTEMKGTWAELEENIETLERSLWPKPDLRWAKNN